MEFFDYTKLTDEDVLKLIENADPCPMCGGKEDLQVGVITEGEDFGKCIVFCFLCQFEIEEEDQGSIVVKDY